jgi:glycosyltransferase involved in cell wall biosynthesis
LKVLQVIPGLNNDSGPTQVVLNLSKELIKLGVEVDICYIEGRGTDLDVVVPKGITLVPCKAILFKKWAFSLAFWKLIKTNISKYDIIHLHSIWLFPNIATWIYAKKNNKKYIIRPAGSLEPWALKKSGLKKKLYFNLIEKRIINNAVAIQTASPKESQSIKKFNFLPKIIEIPNGINLKEANRTVNEVELRLQYRYSSSDFIILFLGRIAPVKNLEFLLRVLVSVQFKIKDLKVIIAGPIKDSYSKKIKRKFEDSHLDVFFSDAVYGLEKDNLLAISDLFVLPSLSENFAVAVAEALAAGLPVIASDNTPWQNLEAKNAGYCLPLNEKTFVEGIYNVYENGKTKYSSFSRLFAKQFKWSNIALETFRSFEKLLNE